MPTMTIAIQDIYGHLDSLVENAQRGTEIVISKAGKPLARLLPFENERPPIRFGLLSGKVSLTDDFDAPLAQDVLSEFEGNECGS